jgi:hypothetical protein
LKIICISLIHQIMIIHPYNFWRHLFYPDSIWTRKGN